MAHAVALAAVAERRGRTQPAVTERDGEQAGDSKEDGGVMKGPPGGFSGVSADGPLSASGLIKGGLGR
ncbi:hypothetical protein GCM10020256_45310 [Streptomyces thermocoprophilus]